VRSAPIRTRAQAAGAAAVIAAAAVCGIAAAGCGSAATSGGTTPGQAVTIGGMNSLRFSPMIVRVHTGMVRITLKDAGSYPHNIVIPALHVTSATVTGDPGGGSVSFTVNFPHAGRYPFHCQYHQSAGMTGVFEVS
jgi:plastocyanin